MKIIGVIPARYASSRFPGKPLANICGKPMIWWVYEQCMKVSELDAVYVATDDERIVTTCNEYNMNVMLTATTHANGTERLGEVASHVDADLYINIQGDEPLIDPATISTLISMFQHANISYGSLKRPITLDEELHSPNVVKIITDQLNRALYLSRAPIPYVRETSPAVQHYAHIGIYGYTKDFLQTFNQLPMGALEKIESIEPLRALEHGHSMHILEVPASNIGVDTLEDLHKVESIILSGHH